METEDMLEAVTESAATKFSFKWTIQDFSMYCGQEETAYSSPDFQFRFKEKLLKFKIVIEVKECEDTSEQSIFARLESQNLKRTSMKHDFILFNSRHEKLAFCAPDCNYYETDEIDWRKLISWDNLAELTQNDDSIVLICNVKIIRKHDDFKSKIISGPTVSHLQSSIVNDFAKLRMDKDLSDFTFLVRDKEFRVHKAILAARSPVFSAMFKHEMKEAKSGKVELDDMEAIVFEEFMKFIYTGNAKVDKYARELLPAADKYDVQDLKSICEDTLAKNITKENCFQILVLSDLHSAQKLEELTIKFIVGNAIKINKKKLAELKDPSLILKLTKALMNR